MAIPRYGDGPEFSKAKKRLKDKDGLPIGRSHKNPILDTSMYEADYKNGHKYLLAANEIAENISDQVDGEGNRNVLFQENF